MTTRSPIILELRQVRAKRLWSQTEIARKAGFHRRTLMKWESEKRIPSWPALEAWADALGFDITLRPRANRNQSKILP